MEHRLTRLEKRLKIPMKDRHDCVGKLQKAVETKIVGERIRHRKNGVAHDKTGKVVNRAVIPVSVQIQGEDAVRKHLDQVKVSPYAINNYFSGNSESCIERSEKSKMDR